LLGTITNLCNYFQSYSYSSW